MISSQKDITTSHLDEPEMSKQINLVNKSLFFKIIMNSNADLSKYINVTNFKIHELDLDYEIEHDNLVLLVNVLFRRK